MPFIPHTEKDVQSMLATIGVKNVDQLFDEIPPALRQVVALNAIPEGMSEMALGRFAQDRAKLDGELSCFIGAGAYEHHIPAMIWQIATRGEFYTAYTPYQAEASQGSLQLIYEFQTMMTRLLAMDVSNASLYDGASALAEAILMAARLSSKKEKVSILMPETIHPHYRATVEAIVLPKDITLISVPYEKTTGRIDMAALDGVMTADVAALVIPQPNFFGVLEEVDELTRWARSKAMLVIAVVNPLSMALLKPPGEWGIDGVDMACGEGQPLGVPLASGGPYYGFLCCKKSHVRHMPGRIVGRTVDKNGKPGYVLTLQAREQHIRRAKATSNICTNQGLMVTASTIYMSLMGKMGLQQVALASHERAVELKQALSKIPQVTFPFSSPLFHEVVVRFEKSVDLILAELAKHRIQGGYSLKAIYPALGESLLVCATETKTTEDIEQFASKLRAVVA
ncbi:MAG: glycine dehydrogenase (aminomethyl-transferring) [Gammaproteobacteria bacterium RIFCSPHIGHO2_12_FULL_42_10]|nr:MAG: glycine dehydrogenase (aminomethyl-transferring) [Gammaproteobacteria bacterium RIFCSPHIGHO2_12_FULL_42_10]